MMPFQKGNLVKKSSMNVFCDSCSSRYDGNKSWYKPLRTKAIFEYYLCRKKNLREDIDMKSQVTIGDLKGTIVIR